MTKHEDQNASIREQFGKQAPAYARLAKNRKNILLERLVQAIEPTRDDRVLDVGCGPGRLSLSMAGVAGHVTGVDLTPEMLDQARALQAEMGIDNIAWREADILPLPFEDRSFSIVVTQATFHHLADPEAVLGEMIRVCEPQGCIVVIDMTFDPAKAQTFDRIEKLRDPSHLRVLSKEELRRLGGAAGLQEIDVWSYAAPLPVEAVLATSAISAEDMEKVRAAYREDAASGEDRLGMNLREENGALYASYPMTMFAWRRV